MRALVGDWVGESSGRSGDARVERSYRWVLQGRFLQEQSVSVYPPQERNPKGERHEHWGLFSYDKAGRCLVLRQFHVEGFVNTYRQALAAAPQLVFDSESFENFSNRWRARESYAFDGPDAFVERFELAAPEQDLALYSRSALRRR